MSVDRKSLAGVRAAGRARFARDYARETAWLSRPLESVHLDPFAEIRSLWSLLFRRTEDRFADAGTQSGRRGGQGPKGLQSGFADDW
jgi:hypothetical protein